MDVSPAVVVCFGLIAEDFVESGLSHPKYFLMKEAAQSYVQATGHRKNWNTALNSVIFDINNIIYYESTD